MLTEISEKVVIVVKVVDGRNIIIKTGENSEDQEFIYAHEFKIKTFKNNFSLSMKTICVSKISDSRGGKNIRIAVDKNPFLKKIDLAGDSVGPGEIHILIGPDLQWYLCYISKILGSRFNWH